jgi:hypothetical protein
MPWGGDSRDCDKIPYMNMMEGLICLVPTRAQCQQMHVQCKCPVNGKSIDKPPCKKAPAGTYMFDGADGLCKTCDTFITTQKSNGTSFARGDFPCRLVPSAANKDGGFSKPNDQNKETQNKTKDDVMEIDCEPGEKGEKSGLTCPHLRTRRNTTSEKTQDFEKTPKISCGPNGKLDSKTKLCACTTHKDPKTGTDLQCWQTNRERSNRYPNGNIKEYCTVGMCNFDSQVCTQ